MSINRDGAYLPIKIKSKEVKSFEIVSALIAGVTLLTYSFGPMILEEIMLKTDYKLYDSETERIKHIKPFHHKNIRLYQVMNENYIKNS